MRHVLLAGKVIIVLVVFSLLLTMIWELSPAPQTFFQKAVRMFVSQAFILGEVILLACLVHIWKSKH